MTKSSKFKPGETGNPEGRPKGSKNKRTVIRDALAKVYGKEGEKEGEKAFWEGVARKAKAGQRDCITLIANRLVPTLKPMDLPLDFPVVANATEGTSTAYEVASQILDAAMQGELTPDQAKALLDGLAGALKIKESTELEERIKALEEQATCQQ